MWYPNPRSIAHLYIRARSSNRVGANTCPRTTPCTVDNFATARYQNVDHPPQAYFENSVSIRILALSLCLLMKKHASGGELCVGQHAEYGGKVVRITISE